ncbi:hypothetical protein GWI33_010917 [Rhynchophorus ferrugineus]|uniref:Uncharacterized protein n=1 Tax=Rhynchophorus ferrugineus TaxID=354439 RepID=A0A834MDQ4_RHYFE|nr:hypothetical protein GWI33_010917 [Rhynchophorus ferrugineus]
MEQRHRTLDLAGLHGQQRAGAEPSVEAFSPPSVAWLRAHLVYVRWQPAVMASPFIVEGYRQWNGMLTFACLFARSAGESVGCESNGTRIDFVLTGTFLVENTIVCGIRTMTEPGDYYREFFGALQRD